MGKDPPSFDILAWSVDGTNLPGRLHGQFLDIFEDNLLAKPGALKVLGTPIDLSQIKVQTLVTGGMTDHLTPWKGCYRTTQLLGGPKHVRAEQRGAHRAPRQPAGQSEGDVLARTKPGPDPEEWLEKATKHTGTWWEVWVDGRASAAAARSSRPRRWAIASTSCSARRRVRTLRRRRSQEANA